MAWRSLGTLTPNLIDWETLNIPVRGEVFRVSQDWVGTWPGTGFISLRLVYLNGALGKEAALEYRRIYPFRDDRIHLFPFDEKLRQSGYTIRYFQAKLGHRARPYAVANWQISIDQFWDRVSRPEMQLDSELTTIDSDELTMDITDTFDIEE
ncbi:hypothetical protein VB780_07220 [Leptolyngbya sp. CCNP1308]|nr:hypothetical protein [Leptolyngbya sp. CCNP1308]